MPYLLTFILRSIFHYVYVGSYSEMRKTCIFLLPLLSLNSLQNKILITSVPVPLKIASVSIFCDSWTKWYCCRSVEKILWIPFAWDRQKYYGNTVEWKETLEGRRRWHCLQFLHTNSFKEKEEQGKWLISCKDYNDFQRCIFALAKFLIKVNIFSGCKMLQLSRLK